MNGGSVTTTTPFTAQDTNGVLVDITSPQGGVATANVVTGGDLMTNLEYIFTSNDQFRVGEVVTISENGGTGVATATIASIHENQTIGAIGTQTAFNTDNPFTASDASGVAVTFGYSANLTTQLGGGLVGTATTSGPTLLDSVQLTNSGYGFMVGDIISVTEDGGGGLGHIVVNTIA